MTETTESQLAAALAKAQGAMKNAALNKVNPHFKSKYADLAAIRDASQKPLADNGLAVVQTMQMALVNEHPTMRLVTTLKHVSGEHVSSEYPLPFAPEKPQVMGSAITYARRYTLAAMLGISAEEDDDANAAQQSNGETVKAKATKSTASAKPNGNGGEQVKAEAPAKPGKIPVPQPLGEDMQPAWKAWIETLLHEITKAEDLETIEAWVKANNSPLKNLLAWNAKTHTYVISEIDKRKQALAPAEAAE